MKLIKVQSIPLEVSFSKAQSSKLEHLFCHVSVKREVRALNFELDTAFENVTPSGIGLHFWIHCQSPKYSQSPYGDIFAYCFKAQSSKLESLFSLKRGKRDLRALSFELSKMSPQVGLAVYMYTYMYIQIHTHTYVYIYIL